MNRVNQLRKRHVAMISWTDELMGSQHLSTFACSEDMVIYDQWLNMTFWPTSHLIRFVSISSVVYCLESNKIADENVIIPSLV